MVRDGASRTEWPQQGARTRGRTRATSCAQSCTCRTRCTQRLSLRLYWHAWPAAGQRCACSLGRASRRHTQTRRQTWGTWRTMCQCNQGSRRAHAPGRARLHTPRHSTCHTYAAHSGVPPCRMPCMGTSASCTSHSTRRQHRRATWRRTRALRSAWGRHPPHAPRPHCCCHRAQQPQPPVARSQDGHCSRCRRRWRPLARGWSVRAAGRGTHHNRTSSSCCRCSRCAAAGSSAATHPRWCGGAPRRMRTARRAHRGSERSRTRSP